MQKKILFIGFVLMLTSILKLQAQYSKQDSTYKKYFVGSTFLMLGNFIPNDPNAPDFAQLNLGYRITPKDVAFLEFKTSKFNWPLGMPWKEIIDEQRTQYNYPGYVRQYVIGLAYNLFWWKGLYTGVHAMSAFQKYIDEDNKKIGNGYTLYLNFHLGYQFKFFKNRFFFEPAIGCSYWPVRTNVPESFKAVEKKWPNYFIQPGLNFGYNFDFKKNK